MIRIISTFVLSLGLILMSAATTFAATLSLDPATAEYAVGDAFTVRVVVDSGDAPINAVTSYINFDPTQLRVVSVERHADVISFWIPNADTDRSILLEGLLLGAGFEGSDASLATITFETLAPGAADVVIAQGAVHAYDGEGTNVLESIGHGRYTIATPTDTASPVSGTTAPTDTEVDTTAPASETKPRTADATYTEDAYVPNDSDTVTDTPAPSTEDHQFVRVPEHDHTIHWSSAATMWGSLFLFIYALFMTLLYLQLRSRVIHFDSRFERDEHESLLRTIYTNSKN